MSLAVVHSRALAGIDAPPVTVEVHLSNGLPGLSIVGLPETEVKESRDRVRSALLTAKFEFPARRITVNLAPPICPKRAGVSICRSRSVSSPLPARSRSARCMMSSSSASWRSPGNCVRCAAHSPRRSRHAARNAR